MAEVEPENLSSEIPEISPELIEIAYAQTNLAEFVRQAWHTVEHETPYRHNWHIDAICEHLEAVGDGQIQNLLINVPPKTGKSVIVGVMWPAFVWATRPWMRWMFTSHSFALAVRDARRCRQMIESDWYQERWGGMFQLTSDQNEKIRYENDHGGQRLTTSIGSGGTGEGAHIIVADDPNDVQKVDSDADRLAVNESWDQKLSIRLIPGAKIRGRVIVMQRSHEDDLAGHVLKQGGYVHLMLPMEFESKRRCVTKLDWIDPRTEEGQPLWPDVYGPPEIADLKLRLGSRGFDGQCQQRPTPRGGTIVKEAWIKTFHERPKFERIILSCDCAFKDKKTSDYVVIGAIGVIGANKYVLDILRERLDMPNTCTAIRTMKSRWPTAEAVLVEDKANGPAVIATMKNEVAGMLPIQADVSKAARLHACTPEIEAGNLFVPPEDSATWVRTFIDELTKFPGAAHDDQVDMISQALNWLRTDNRCGMHII